MATYGVSRTARRRGAGLLAAAMLLSACQTTAAGGGGDAPLTAEQRALHREAERFNETVATGALAGALGGALIGALLCGESRAACALGGAAAGGFVGGNAGHYVAVQNRRYADQEAALDARIRAADAEIARYHGVIENLERVVAAHRRTVAFLVHRFEAGEITVAEYRDELSRIGDDIDAAERLIADNRQAVQAIEGDIRRTGGSRPLLARRDQLVRQQRILREQVSELTALMNVEPVA